MFDIDAALRYLIQVGGSDLHAKVPSPPLVRLNGRLQPIEGAANLSGDDMHDALRHVLEDHDKLIEFDDDNEVDFAYSIEGLARFRVNAFRQRGSISMVCRAIPYSIRSVDELGLPPVISKLADEERGIILLTGTTGSGKSTSLAAMIDHINEKHSKHIVTIEDPIEYLHRDKTSILNQREVGQDTASFKRALRRVLRQDPDVILIGEMRDEETVQTALSAAETGHLVLSTLHTVDAAETINRIIDFFPPHQHQQARAMIAGTLKGIVSQRLVPTVHGDGRVAVCEVLVMTGRVRDMIMDPALTGRLVEVISEGEYYGMQTFDQALLAHVQAGRVSMTEALKAATNPHDFKLLLAADGKRATTMDSLRASQAEHGDDGSAPATAVPGPNTGSHREPAPVSPVVAAAPGGSSTQTPPPPAPATREPATHSPAAPSPTSPAPSGSSAPGAPAVMAMSPPTPAPEPAVPSVPPPAQR